MTDHNHDFTSEDLKLLQDIKENPVAYKKIASLLEGIKAETQGSLDPYHVEQSVSEFTQQVGKVVLEGWAQDAQHKATEQEIQKDEHRKHGKKKSTGIAPLDE